MKGYLAHPTLEFLGAAGTVTGSRSLLIFQNTRVLIDCGLFQGSKESRQRNWEPFPVDPHLIECVLLTHAHLDHSGYLPRLVSHGFKGPIYCSEGTAELVKVLLLDSAKIQEEDAGYANKTGHSKHKPALPLYTKEDADKVFPLIKVIPDQEWVQIFTGISIKLFRAGHITGARSILVNLAMAQQSELLCFSGDLGHPRMKTLRGPVAPPECDYLVLESTYGDRLHERIDPLDALEGVIRQIVQDKGVLVIPAFAVGRSQEIIYMIRLLENEKRIPVMPVVLDSPMSNKATEIFLKHTSDHQPSETLAPQDAQSFFPTEFRTVESPDDSFLACMQGGPMIVVSAAGMLNGGRILHHLKSRLPHAENIVLFAGYQAEGTKGRFLQDKGKAYGTLRIHHEEVEVNARIETMPALSAHGDYEDLLNWLSHFRRAPKKIFLNHGDPEALQSLKKHIVAKLGWDTEIAVDAKVIKL